MRLHLLFVVSILFAGCAEVGKEGTDFSPAELNTTFELSAGIVKTNGFSELRIELRNITSKSQRLLLITDPFPGHLQVENANGEKHQFTQSNYFNYQMTGASLIPVVTFSPGQSIVYTHPLSSFIDPMRPDIASFGSNTGTRYPTLDKECQGQCTIQCWMKIYARKGLGRGWTGENVGKLVAKEIQLE